jgi:phospholipase/lecithinase/hemolysin
VVIALSVAGPLEARQFKKIIAFGDSLSDVGNAAKVTIDGNAPRIDGYYKQTHYSDNVIWIEQLADYWGLRKPRPGRAATTSLPPKRRGTVWAWGGAEALPGYRERPQTVEPVPNLLIQVESYLDTNRARRRILYTIWAGSNNFLAGDISQDGIEEAVGTIVASLRLLESRGARHIVVTNLPNLGHTPYAQSLGPEAVVVAEAYTLGFNALLIQALNGLRRESGFRAKLYMLDAFSEFHRIVETVRAGGVYEPDFFVPGPPVEIDNVSGFGLAVYAATGQYPPGYLFWDPVHPSTQGHQIATGVVLETIRNMNCAGPHVRCLTSVAAR